MEWYLPVIWAALIGTAVAMYVILDGFDLGVGILFPYARSETERDQMMNSVAPFWDGNETWLVLGGGGLLVAFPGAYAVIMPAFYLPVIVMLLALVLRGVAFEFRWVAATSKSYWNTAFAFGSTTDIVIMGIYTAVMNVVQGSVIAPLVYGRAVSLHPAVVLVAIPAGGTLGGILGMFLAVPILGIAAGVWRHLLAAMGSEDPATRVAVEPAAAPTTAAPPVQAPIPGPAPGT